MKVQKGKQKFLKKLFYLISLDLQKQYTGEWDTFEVETVKESRKNCNFHFDLQLHPTVLNGTYLYCQIIGFIPLRAQNF